MSDFYWKRVEQHLHTLSAIIPHAFFVKLDSDIRCLPQEARNNAVDDMKNRDSRAISEARKEGYQEGVRDVVTRILGHDLAAELRDED